MARTFPLYFFLNKNERAVSCHNLKEGGAPTQQGPSESIRKGKRENGLIWSEKGSGGVLNEFEYK